MKKIWVRRNLVFGIVLLTYVFTGLYISFFPLEYAATAKISFRPFAYDIQNIEDVRTETQISPAIFLKEEEVITSDAVLLKVIEKHWLIKNWEYNSSLRPKKILNSFFQKLGSIVKNQPDLRTEEQKIKERLLRDIFITTIPYSEIDITVKSESPKLAAELADTLAMLYVVESNQGGKKEILEKAKIPDSASFEKFYNLVQLAGVFGILIGILFACLIPRISRETDYSYESTNDPK